MDLNSGFGKISHFVIPAGLLGRNPVFSLSSRMLKGFTMRSVTEECECVICGNEADLVIDCNLVDASDSDHMKILPKDLDVQVMPGN